MRKAIKKGIKNSTPEKGTPPENTASVSRQSYDSLTENFSSLIDLVSSVPSYVPSEANVSVASFGTFGDGLQTVNTNVINAEITYSNIRVIIKR